MGPGWLKYSGAIRTSDVKLDQRIHLIRQRSRIRRNGSAMLPGGPVFHAQVDKDARRGLANPSSHSGVHFLPDRTEVSDLSMVSWNKLAVGNPGFRKSVSNDFPEMRRKTQAAQADPRYPGSIDHAEDVFDRSLVI